MIKILDLYISKEVISALLYGITAFTCILGGGVILLPLVGEAVKFNISFLDTFLLLCYRLPSVMVFIFPMSMLLATILSVSRLRSDLEILAFRASGISFNRIIFPVLMIGLLLSFATLGFQELVIPRSMRSAEDLIYHLTQKDRPDIKKNINYTEYDKDGNPLRILNVQRVENKLLQNITLAEYEDGELVRLIKAENGKWVKTGGWQFFNGSMYMISQKQKDKILYLEFKKEYINLNINPVDLSKREKLPEEMSAQELKEHIAFKIRTGKDAKTDLVKFHMRFSIPFASLIFAIVGSSVGLKSHRSSSSIGLGISLIIIMLYYLFISLGMYLGMTGAIPVILAAWLPNLVIGGFGIYTLSKNTM